MKTEKVDKRYVIRLTESEAAVIEKRFVLSRMNSVSAYLRQQVVNGIYLEYDHEELKKIRQAVMSVANNINQIAAVVNETYSVTPYQMKMLQNHMTEIHGIVKKASEEGFKIIEFKEKENWAGDIDGDYKNYKSKG